jgi:uncharacterized protein RhaS with RHS repeats
VLITDNSFEGSTCVASGTNTFSLSATDASGNSTTQSYSVPVGSTTATMSYDANGNLLSDGTRTYEWDAENKLVPIEAGVNRTEFTHNGAGRRVRIISESVRLGGVGHEVCLGR